MSDLIEATTAIMTGESAPPTKSEAMEAIKKFNKSRKFQVISTADRKPICNHIPTGIFSLDLANLGGFAENSSFMVYGLESSAKTTTMLKLVAQFQRKYPDMYCAWIDAEMTFDSIWAARQGVDVTRLLFCQPESGEEGIDAMETLLRSRDVSFVAVDSIPALVPMALKDRSAEDKTMAGNSALIGVMMSKYLASISDERRRDHFPTLGVINQIRDSMASYGSPYKIPGGKQLKYQTQTWIRIKGRKLSGKDRWGADVPDRIEQSFVVEKNKVGSSITEGEWKMGLNPSGCQDEDLPQGVAVSQGQTYEVKTVMTFARRMGFITGGGSRWRIAGIDEPFGKIEAMEIFLYANPLHELRLRQMVIAAYRQENGLPAFPPDEYLLCDTVFD